MKTKKKIDPAKAVPQAARDLRIGSRARAAEPTSPTPNKAKDDEDDDDEDEDDDDEDRAAEMKSCAESCRAAESAYAAGAEAMAAAAKELEGGTDSLSVLMAAEDAARTADSASDAALAALTKYRGAEAKPSESDAGATAQPPPAAPAPGAARALTALAGARGGAQVEIAQLAALGRDVMARAGAKDIASAQLKLEAAFVALGEVAQLRAKEAARAKAEQAAAITRRLEAAVHAGMDRAKAFNIDAKGKVLGPKAIWTASTLEQLDAVLVEMGYPAGAEARIPGAPTYARSTLITPPADGEAGLAARAQASGMTIEQRREAEARINACIAQDQENAR